jgi:aromatic-L-amino-acid decarboxylase
MTVYASAEAHSSIEKAARIAGIGSQQLRKMPVTADGGMDPIALVERIHNDREQGFMPACIVACFGTTGVGAIDPISEVGRIAQSENLFLHVDAAWAGSALIVPEIRETIGSLEHVDSFVFNPHKWLFTNFDCSAFYMRDPKPLISAMSLTPVYLESRAGAGSPEYRDWSVPLGRRFRALKLWFVLRSYGAETLRSMVRAHIEYSHRLAAMIELNRKFELCFGPSFAMLTFRYLGSDPAASATDLDLINEKLIETLNNDGFVYLTKTRFNGRVVIRFNIGQTYTTWKHVEGSWQVIQATASRIAE